MLFRARTYRDLLFHVLIMASIAAILVLLFFYFYLPSTTHHGEAITVPNTIGMSVSEVEGVLNARRLRYQLSDSVYDARRPPRTVIMQSPRAGSQVKADRKVYLTVTLTTPPDVPMPRLLGRSLTNAKAELDNNGLLLGNIEYKPDLQENAVLEQRWKGQPIKEGKPLPKGSRVDLVVADGRGKQEFSAPDLTGMALEDAEFTLAGSGLVRGKIVFVEDETQELGTILRQQPAPGRNLRVGDIVDVWVVGYEPE